MCVYGCVDMCRCVGICTDMRVDMCRCANNISTHLRKWKNGWLQSSGTVIGIFIHIYIYTHTYIHIYTHIYTHTHLNVLMCIRFMETAHLKSLSDGKAVRRLSNEKKGMCVCV